jgi:hypothetical protein
VGNVVNRSENERQMQRRDAKAQSFYIFSLRLSDSAFILTVRLIVVVGRGVFSRQLSRTAFTRKNENDL